VARKPIHLQAAGHLTPRERIWAAIRRQRVFGVKSIEDETRVEVTTITTYLQALEAAGHIAVEVAAMRGEAGQFESAKWRLVRDAGVAAPRLNRSGGELTQGRGNEQMWRAMRILGEFDYRDIAVHASTEDCWVCPATAKTYVVYLARAGYLALVRPARPGTPARYRLIRAKVSGPKAPQIQRVKSVYDPNTGRIVWMPGGAA
jgi:hypothetical protein